MISRDEWLSALGDAAAPTDPDAQSISELCEMFQIDRMACYRRINELVKSGQAIRTWKYSRMINGAQKRVPAYRLVKAGKNGRQR